MDQGTSDEIGRRELGQRIQRAYRKQRLTLKQLADRAGYDEKTIRNAIRGEKTRIGTLEDICTVLDIALYESTVADDPSHGAIGNVDYGGYAKAHYEDYIGVYLAHRRSFTFSENILRSIYQFAWDSAKRCLIFKEFQQYYSKELNRPINYSQDGTVYISNSINLLHLLTIVKGAVRLVTLSRMLVNDKTLRGIVLTQAQGEFYFQPSVSPIFLQKLGPETTPEMVASQIGSVHPGDPDYAGLHEELLRVQEKVALFAMGDASGRASRG